MLCEKGSGTTTKVGEHCMCYQFRRMFVQRGMLRDESRPCSIRVLGTCEDLGLKATRASRPLGKQNLARGLQDAVEKDGATPSQDCDSTLHRALRINNNVAAHAQRPHRRRRREMRVSRCAT